MRSPKLVRITHDRLQLGDDVLIFSFHLGLDIAAGKLGKGFACERNAATDIEIKSVMTALLVVSQSHRATDLDRNTVNIDAQMAMPAAVSQNGPLFSLASAIPFTNEFTQ